MSKSIHITVLVENHAEVSSLGAEHGLAYWIQSGDSVILFDTGQSDLVVKNADLLGLSIDRVSAVALSHGHYDHCGGLAALKGRVPRQTPLFVHPDFNCERYSIKNPQEPKRVGVPSSALDALDAFSLHSVQSPTEIIPNSGIWMTGEIPRNNSYEDTGGPFFLDAKGTLSDPIVDDQALWFASDHGLVIVLGCAHAGIVNTIEHCKSCSGIDRVHAVIGGFHLLNASEVRLQKTMTILAKDCPDCLAACHCTGEGAMQRMRDLFPNQWKPCGAGTLFRFFLNP